MPREIVTDNSGMEGIRWHIENNRHIFIPNLPPDSDDAMVSLKDDTDKMLVGLRTNKQGYIRAAAMNPSSDCLVRIEHIPDTMLFFDFMRTIAYSRNLEMINAGFRLGPDDSVMPIASDSHLNDVDFTAINILDSLVNTAAGQHTVVARALPGMPLFTLEQTGVEWKFGYPDLLFRINTHAALSDARDAARMLLGKISTNHEAAQIGKHLTYLHRDIFLPAG